MKLRRWRATRQLCHALVLLASIACTGFAHTAAAAAPSTATVAPAREVIEAVPAGKIALQAEVDEQFAQDVVDRAKGPDLAPEFASSLEKLEASVRGLAGRYKVNQLGAMHDSARDTLRRYWKLREQQLADWTASVRDISMRQSADVAEIASRRAKWEATRASAGVSGLPPVVLTRVSGVLEKIQAAERAFAGPLNSQLQLSRRGQALQVQIDTALKEIDAAQANVERRLMSRDAPPLFAGGDTLMDAGGDELSVLKQRRDLERQFLLEYAEFHGVRLRILTVAAMVLLWLLLAASRRYRKQSLASRQLRADAPILERPLSAWLLIVVVAFSYFEPDAPAIVRSVLVLLALVPVLRLLPAAEFAVVKRLPFFAAALYLLYKTNILFVGTHLFGRVHLILVGLLAILAVWYLLARLSAHSLQGKATGYSALTRGIGHLSMAALVIGLGANVIGNVTLAAALTGGVINSGYAGLAIYAAAGVLRALLVQLTTSRKATQSYEEAQRRLDFAQGLTQLLRAIAFVTWLVLTLAGFRVLRPVADALRGVLDHPVAIGSVSVTLGGLLLFVACVVASFWVANAVRFVLRDEVLPHLTLPRGTANSIATLSYYGVVLVGLLVAMLVAGLEASQLTIVLGALGVGVGFGLQNVVNNFFSGLILMFERPIQPGDTVAISGVEGTVREIAMRATRVRTFDGADVFVPNGALLSANLTNWTLADVHRRFDVTTGVAYGSDMPKVFAVLMQAARTTAGVASTPEPLAIFTGFGNSSLDFMLRVWTHDNANWIAIRGALSLAVHDGLVNAGIEIPFPQRDLHLRSVSPQARADLSVTPTPPAAGEEA